ncbi:hypothetical protein ACM0P6_02995 [Komagataeibacter sucrofermentans]|uniref:Uncharacterized protein n=1 Tax=Komagataeibacter sucrofermentans TaxID=1053551 RepID=A0A318QKE5_9PROT|nr:hypothetical protein [Komagataeibacter sucrofermentans]PYD79956.1 hypothetical protein CFR77_05450 [Komagataeibacter sucrofermentans]GBQ52184.1 hypothetical protein AA15973_2684 [Komagataeibacter sucrofermentans DSM 15973]
MSKITIIPIRRGPPPSVPDALQDIIVRRQMAESAILNALPRQGAGIALLMSERRALRAATAELNRQMDAEEAELNRIARRHVARHLPCAGRGVA